MKIRLGFVSNSSSSSFVINRENLTAKQQEQIRDHINVAKSLSTEFFVESDYAWSIDETETRIIGTTWLDNFDMRTFLELIGVNGEHITWDEE